MYRSWMPFEPIGKPSLTDEVAQEIGRLHAAFNWMEWTVVGLLEGLAVPKVPIDAMVGHLQFRAIVETTRNALACAFDQYDDNELADRIDAVLKRVLTASAFRNDLAHGMFSEETLLGLHALFKRQRNGLPAMQGITVSIVKGKRDEIETLVDELQVLIREYVAMANSAG